MRFDQNSKQIFSARHDLSDQLALFFPSVIGSLFHDGRCEQFACQRRGHKNCYTRGSDGGAAKSMCRRCSSNPSTAVINNCARRTCWLVDMQQRQLYPVGAIRWPNTCTTVASGASARGKKGNPMKKFVAPLLMLTCLTVWIAFAEVKTDYSHSADFSRYKTIRGSK